MNSLSSPSHERPHIIVTTIISCQTLFRVDYSANVREKSRSASCPSARHASIQRKLDSNALQERNKSTDAKHGYYSS